MILIYNRVIGLRVLMRKTENTNIRKGDISMKRILASLLVVCFLGFNSAPAMAAILNDITSGYWATREISQVVDDEIMTTDSNGNFLPESTITRADFVSALLKVLRNSNLDANPNNNYSDVQPSDSFYDDIMRSDALDLVHGYPDGSFKPNQAILRSECTAVISHITKDLDVDVNIVNKFTDVSAIPTWAVDEYAKSLTYGIYVNHPDPNMLEPNRALTRAEAAVIFYQLKNKLGFVKSQYVGEAAPEPETLLGIEHLNAYEKAPNDKVKITNYRQIILQGNAFTVAFDDTFWSKKHHAGERVNFVLPSSLYTKEGTKLLPAGTKVIADIAKIEPPRCCNKNARVHLIFKSIVLPDGSAYDMYGKPFTKDYTLKEGPWMTFWKLFASTVTFGCIGAGAGTGFAFIPNPAKIGTGLAIGIPVGCTIGLITGLITPGLHYRAKKGELVPVILLDDASVNDKRPESLK